MIVLKGDGTSCTLCQKEFDPQGDAVSRHRPHWIGFRQFRTSGITYKISGALCCICITKVSNKQINQVMDGRLGTCRRIPFASAADM